jgi:hypothetical protein
MKFKELFGVFRLLEMSVSAHARMLLEGGVCEGFYTNVDL